MLMLRYRGVVMGGRTGPLIITDWSPPVVEKRGDAYDRLRGHGQAHSRQWLGGRNWQWTLNTNGSQLSDAYAMSGALEREWLNYADMETTEDVPLEYSLDDGLTWWRVYGRPGRFTPPKPDVRAVQGSAAFDVEFTQTDPLHYSNTSRSTTITASAAVLGGWSFPLEFPLTTAASGAERSGQIVNDGDKPAPVQVVFYGPSSDPVVTTSHGYEIGFRGSLAWDQWVSLDPRAGSVLLNGVTPVPGRLTVRSILSDLTAPPGVSDWYYRALDEAGTSRAVLSWRSAFTSMQYGGS